MDRRDIEQIDRFLSIVGKATLFEYFEIEHDTAADDVEAAIKKRRSWAQGQQSNPKYRSESLWVIKNVSLAKRVLIDQRDAYLQEVQGRDSEKNLEVLTLFIRGTLVDGSLTPRKEEAIRQQGEQLGLTAMVVAARIEEMMAELGASRDGVDETSIEGPLVDHYAALEVARDAPQEVLEKAYRARYRWARNLRDVKRASAVYAQLDEAWRHLKDAERRAQYDAQLAASGPPPASTAESAPESPPKTDLDISPGAPPARAQPRQPLGFADQKASIPPIRQAPRPPDRIKGRTLGLEAQAQHGSARTPRLQIEGPDVHRIVAWRKAISVRFAVRNAGAGKMSGRVFSDRDWVDVSPARLDPDANRQAINVTVHPRSMPRTKAVSLVTVVADHGERKVVTIETERRLLPSGAGPMVVFGLIVLGVMGLVLGAMTANTGNAPLPQDNVESLP